MHENKLVLLAYCIENLTQLVYEAENRNLPVEVLVKDDTLFEIIKRNNANYIVGVCCPEKIKTVTPHLEKRGIEYKAVSANNGLGCFKKTGKKLSVDIKEYTSALDWLKLQV